MRLFLFTVLLVLANMSFAQSVWDQYPPKGSTPIVKNEPEVSQNESMYSRPRLEKIVYSYGSWYAGTRKISDSEMEALVSTNPDAAAELRAGKSLYSKALILSVVGGAALGLGIGFWVDDISGGKPLTIGGGAVALFAIVLGGISGNHMTSAVEIYNKSLGHDTSLQIKIAPTPQGGAALAFAF